MRPWLAPFSLARVCAEYLRAVLLCRACLRDQARGINSRGARDFDARSWPAPNRPDDSVQPCLLRSTDWQPGPSEGVPEASHRDRPQVQINGTGRSGFGTAVAFVGQGQSMIIDYVCHLKKMRGAFLF